MNQFEQSPRGFFVSRETVEHYEQTAIVARMALEMLNAYGPTDEVLAIIQDSQRNGFPRSLFDLKR